MMENLTQLEYLFLELLRSLSDQQREDVMRILEILQQSVE
jgi:hypothetical protein